MFDDLERELDWSASGLSLYSALTDDEADILLDDLDWKNKSYRPHRPYVPGNRRKCTCGDSIGYMTAAEDMQREQFYTRGVGCALTADKIEEDTTSDHDAEITIGYTERDRERLQERYPHISQFF